MRKGRSLDRKAVAEIVASWADSSEMAVFVGNGFLLREVFSAGDRASNFYLFGGMGLASAVACGYLEAHPELRAAVVEGDGNFLMGLCSAAFCGAVGGDLTHIVFGNGSYESTGDQPVPLSDSADVVSVARGLGYTYASVVKTSDDLRSELERATHQPGPVFVWAQGGSREPVPPRPPLDPGTMTERFRNWSGKAASRPPMPKAMYPQSDDPPHSVR